MSAAAGVASAVITLLAGIFAAYQVILASHDRRDRERPFVVVDLAESAARSYTSIIELVVANAGLTVARDVKLQFLQEPNDQKSGLPLLSEQLGQGIPTLPPRREFRFAAGSITHTLDGKFSSTSGAIEVVVTCHDDKGRTYSDRFNGFGYIY